MSTQVCRIKGFGYKFDGNEKLFDFLKDEDDEEYNFLDVIGLEASYYDFKKQSDSNEPNLKVITDGMCGEYKYVMFVDEVSYIENTHGDSFWVRKFRSDKWIKDYAKSKIETLLGRKLGEPKEWDFQHYS